MPAAANRTKNLCIVPRNKYRCVRQNKNAEQKCSAFQSVEKGGFFVIIDKGEENVSKRNHGKKHL